MIPIQKSFFSLVLAFLKRDLRLEEFCKLTILHKLLVGPLISVTSLGVVYSGLFRRFETLSLGDLNRQNYGFHLLFGFFVHAVLNSGYYCYSNRLCREIWYGTFSLIFLTPTHPFLTALGTATLDILRSMVVIGLTTMLLFFMKPTTLWGLSGVYCVVLGLAVIGFSMGYLRTFIQCVAAPYLELLDSFFMASTFLGALYVPLSVYPQFFQPLIRLNPIYLAKESALRLWEQDPWSEIYSYAIPFWGSIGIICALTLCFLPRMNRKLRAEVLL